MANIPRQYQTGLVNVVGVNNMGTLPQPNAPVQMPQPQGLPVQEPSIPQYDNIPDITEDKFRQLASDSEQRYNLVMESMKFQAGVRQAALAAKGVPKRQQELAGIFDGIASAGLKYLEYEKEKEAAKDDLEKQRNSMMARAALEEITINARQQIRQYGDREGIHTTREDARRVLDYYSQILPPEEMIPLYTFYGTEMRELENTASTRYYEAVQEQENAQISLVKANINYQLSGIVGRMTNPQLAQTDIDVLFNQAYDAVIQGSEGLDPVARMQLIGEALQPLAQTATVTAGQRTAIEQRMADLEWFIPYVEQELRPKYGDSPTDFQYALWASAPESIRGLVGDIPNNMQITQSLAQELGAQSEIQAHYRQQYQQQQFAQGIQPPVVKMGLELAHRMMSGDSQSLAQLAFINQKKPEERTPHEVLALQYYEQWRTDATELSTLREQLNAAEGPLARRILTAPLNSVPQTTVWTNPVDGKAYLLTVEGPDGQPVYTGQELTPEQREAAIASIQADINESNRIKQEVQRLIERSASSGFDVTNPANRGYLDMIFSELDQQAATEQFGSHQTTLDPSGNPNFGFTQTPNAPAPITPAPNSPNAVRTNVQDLSGFNWSANEPPPGYPSGQSPVAPLARMNNHVIPFSHNRTDIQVSSEYGMRTSPTSGQYRLHAGVDFASTSMYNEDVGAVTPAGGHVIGAFDWNGYGGTVLVQTSEGYIEQYSHLRSFFVKPGDAIRPGQPVGVVGGGAGDPMPGGSTGRHLHLQVWKPGMDHFTDPEEGTIDALLYLEQLQEFQDVPRGAGPAPGRPVGASSYMPTPNSVPDGRGNWYGTITPDRFPYLTRFLNQGGGLQALQNIPVQSVPAEQVYNNTAPQSSGRLSPNRDAYPGQNNPTHNYGYSVIANDPQFARALAEVSDEIGIPAVWLADLMAHESAHTWDPGVQGPNTYLGRGIGLIQAMSGGVLADWGYSVSEVASMSRAQYTREIARRYLLPFKGRINSVRDLASAIFTGDIGSSGGSSDGYSTLDNYVRNLGRAVGRSYASGGDYIPELGMTHESFTQGCAICQQQLNNFNAIIPHEVH